MQPLLRSMLLTTAVIPASLFFLSQIEHTAPPTASDIAVCSLIVAASALACFDARSAARSSGGRFPLFSAATALHTMQLYLNIETWLGPLRPPLAATDLVIALFLLVIGLYFTGVARHVAALTKARRPITARRAKDLSIWLMVPAIAIAGTVLLGTGPWPVLSVDQYNFIAIPFVFVFVCALLLLFVLVSRAAVHQRAND